jgi:hypothetical protein
MNVAVLSNNRPITIVTACMKHDGSPTFALSEILASRDEIADGIHYYLAEADLQERGFEEPFVHFDENEAPPFLHRAVRDFLAPASKTTPLVTTEER